MENLILRGQKGSNLTAAEVDSNFTKVKAGVEAPSFAFDPTQFEQNGTTVVDGVTVPVFRLSAAFLATLGGTGGGGEEPGGVTALTVAATNGNVSSTGADGSLLFSAFNAGAVFTQTVPENANFRISCEITDIATDASVIFGCEAEAGVATQDAIAYAFQGQGTILYAYPNGNATGIADAFTANTQIGLRRTNGTLYLETAPLGSSTWTLRYTFIGSSTAAMYLKATAAAVGKNLRKPQLELL